MSNWTHINGCVSIHTSPLIKTEDGNLKLPYPEKQAKLGTASACIDPEENTAYLRIEFCETSLPIIEEKVKDAISVLPTGEQNRIDYNIYQSDMMDNGCSSDFDTDEEEDLFYELLAKAGYDDYELNDIKLDWVRVFDSATLTILDDVRYCDGDEMMSAMLDFFKKLIDSDIYLSLGQFNWYDDYGMGEYKYVIQLSSEGVFAKIYDKSNSLVAHKDINIDYNCDDSGKFVRTVDTKESDNWKDYIKENKQ